MNIDSTFSLYALLVANAALLAAVGLAMSRFRRQLSSFEQFWNSPTGAALAEGRQEESEPPAAVVGLERRVTELQRLLRTIQDRRPETAIEHGPRLPIENAVRMARHGATIDDLVRNCGLNVGEAQLMRKLHGKKREPVSVNGKPG